MIKRFPGTLPFLFLAAALGAEERVLELSLEDAIAQALETNLTVRIERIEPSISRESLRFAKGAFDPALEAGYTYSNTERFGFSTEFETAEIRAGVSGQLPWGTRYFLGMDATDQTTPFDLTSGAAIDSVDTFAGLSITQPVLRNFGLKGSFSEVRVARLRVEQSEASFERTVMDIVAATVRAYMDYYFAQGNLEVAERNRDLASQLLEDNRKRVETGVMAPLDLVQAESEAALREVSVISAEALLRQSENRLKNLILDSAETFFRTRIRIEPPAEPTFEVPDLRADFKTALSRRPEVLIAEHELKSSELDLDRSRQNALPQLDLVASAGRQGRDDRLNSSWSALRDNGRDEYSIGAVFSLPFPNRSRSAEKATAFLNRNQARLAITQVQQQIQLEIDNTATQLEADWKRIQAARTARQLAEKSLEAEEKKLQAGTSSTFIVLRLQGDLAAAEIREINALTDYLVSLAEYERARGLILEKFGITLDD